MVDYLSFTRLFVYFDNHRDICEKHLGVVVAGTFLQYSLEIMLNLQFVGNVTNISSAECQV